MWLDSLISHLRIKIFSKQMRLKNYVAGEWVEGTGNGTPLFHAVTGEQIAIASSEGLDFHSFFRGVGF